MRICVVTNIAPYGVAGGFSWAVVEGFSNHNDEVFFVVPYHPSGKRLQRENITYHTVKKPFHFKAALKAISVSKRQNVDIIYTQSPRVAFWLSILGFRYKAKFVREVHGLIADEQIIDDEGKFFRKVKKRILWWVDLKSAHKANAIRVVTYGIKEEYVEKGIYGDKISVIPNGVDICLFHPIPKEEALDQTGLGADKQYVTFVGLFLGWAGVEYLVQALPKIIERVPNAELLLVGYGPEKNKIDAEIQRQGMAGHVRFTGRIPHTKVPTYINASVVCTTPLILKRNEKIGVSPLKVYEYLACGKPVVCSRLRGLEFVEKTNVGILVEPENSEELAEGILRILEDASLRKEMEKNARKIAEREHSWEEITKKVNELCQEALDK